MNDLTVWLKSRHNAGWLVEEYARRAPGQSATARQWDRYTRVQLPYCAEARRLLDEVGLVANSEHTQDWAVTDYRKANRWREA